ncbi:flagellar motor stator protein MotA [Sphingomonas sp. 8AM]|uniref:flagellar motor stator protein MotA n=1 Tax=Sphingomonas sp. 8AM TaxID=2653170 RepID=UPI0012EFD357|nr:flagellar motor stator protein MotA [Sphingomonas sp. 8AM]VXC32455.1 Flagellar motor protein MotA (modular protein) [Sphingomonas sp. 8AM]
MADLPLHVTVLLILFARVGAIVMALPIFSEEGIPVQIRLMMALGLTLGLSGLLGARVVAPAADGALIATTLSEFVTGAAIGLIVRMVFSAAATAGSLISMQVGLSSVLVPDALLGGQTPLLGRFLTVASLVVCMAMGVHHLWIGAIIHSYDQFPVGGTVPTADLARVAVLAAARALELALTMAAPLIVYALVFNSALGLAARLTPSLQIFFVAQPLNIGMVVTLLCVFGGFLIAGGNLSVIGEALPHEILTIVGAAIGAFILGNSVPVVKRALAGVAHIFRGPRWNEGDYRDLLALLFALLTTFRNGGGMAIEKHIDAPEQSPLFAPYPRLCADTALIHFICDYLRMMTVNLEDPYQIAEAMENDIERHHAEVMVPQHAIQLMADGLPALGIVAAVLGVINTMGSIDQPTQILGAMIGSALVGTFLGVLLAYGFVGPIASKLQQTLDAEQKPYTLVKTAIVAYAQRMPVQVAVELARRMTPSGYAPSFGELEQALDVARDELVATQAKAA